MVPSDWEYLDLRGSTRLGPSEPDDGSTVGFQNEEILNFTSIRKWKKGGGIASVSEKS